MNLVSILKKIVMAVTGLGLFGFVVTHLLGNLLLLGGPERYNGYADALLSIPLLPVAQVGLLAIFITHVASALRLTKENRAARPEPYAHKAFAGGASTLGSRTMAVGGVVILVFLVSHIWMFKFGDWTQEHGLWGLVVRSFKNPLITLWYLVALSMMGLHLSHGLASAFQSLGVDRPDRPELRRKLRVAGSVVGWAITVGFIILPIWALFVVRT